MTQGKLRKPIKKTPSRAETNEMQNEKIVNLTGEPVIILIDNKETTIPPEKEVAYVTPEFFPPREAEEINKIKIIKKSPLETILPITKNLPPPADNTMYIVPWEVAMNEQGRPDVFYADSKNHLTQYKNELER